MDIVAELDTALLLKLTSFLFWSCLYLLSNLKQPDKSPEYHSRAVTLLHGSVSCIVGLVQCGVASISICRLTGPVLPRHYALMVWSWGYFAFDSLWCLLYWDQGPLMLAHHFCTLIAITVYMHKNGTGCSFSCTMAFMEITNPLLQTRWFLKTGGLGKTPLFYIVDVMYLSSFLLIRGVLGPYILYKIMPIEVFGIDQKVIAVILYIISIGLMLELVSYINYRYMPKLILHLQTNKPLQANFSPASPIKVDKGVLGPYILYKIMPIEVFGIDQKVIAVILYIISIGLMLELVSYINYRSGL